MRCSTIRINGAIVPAITVCELDVKSAEIVVDEHPHEILITDVNGLASILATVPENIPDAPGDDGEYVLKVDTGATRWVEPATPGLPSEVAITGSHIQATYGSLVTTINDSAFTVSNGTTSTIDQGGFNGGNFTITGESTVIDSIGITTNGLTVNGEVSVASNLYTDSLHIATAGSGASVVYSFPTTDGTAGQILTTDGGGSVSWADAATIVSTNNLLQGDGSGGVIDSEITNSGGSVTAVEFTGTTRISATDGGGVGYNINANGTFYVNGGYGLEGQVFTSHGSGSTAAWENPLQIGTSPVSGSANNGNFLYVNGSGILSENADIRTDGGNLICESFSLNNYTALPGDGSFYVNNSFGTAGQVLNSQGPGLPAIWSDAGIAYNQSLNNTDSVLFGEIRTKSDGANGKYVCYTDADSVTAGAIAIFGDPNGQPLQDSTFTFPLDASDPACIVNAGGLPMQILQEVCVDFTSALYVSDNVGYFDIPAELDGRTINSWRIRAITAGTGSGSNNVTLYKNGSSIPGFSLDLLDGDTIASDNAVSTTVTVDDLLSVNVTSITDDVPAFGLMVTIVFAGS